MSFLVLFDKSKDVRHVQCSQKPMTPYFCSVRAFDLLIAVNMQINCLQINQKVLLNFSMNNSRDQ